MVGGSGLLSRIWAQRTARPSSPVLICSGYAYQSLSTAESTLFDRYYNAQGDEHLEFCQLFGPDKIVANLGGFLGYFMIRKVMAGQDLKRAAGTISYRPLRGRFDEGPSKGPAVS